MHYVRHPIYAGAFIFMSALGLVAANSAHSLVWTCRSHSNMHASMEGGDNAYLEIRELISGIHETNTTIHPKVQA